MVEDGRLSDETADFEVLRGLECARAALAVAPAPRSAVRGRRHAVHRAGGGRRGPHGSTPRGKVSSPSAREGTLLWSGILSTGHSGCSAPERMASCGCTRTGRFD